MIKKIKSKKYKKLAVNAKAVDHASKFTSLEVKRTLPATLHLHYRNHRVGRLKSTHKKFYRCKGNLRTLLLSYPKYFFLRKKILPIFQD